jgi:diguanylate cyclase (GGDEF)-like protein
VKEPVEARQVWRRHPVATTLLLALLLAAAAAAIGLTLPGSTHVPSPTDVTWWQLALGFAAAELLVVHYQFLHERYTFTFIEVPLVLGMFVAGWPAVVVGRALGIAVVGLGHRRSPPLKVVFNVALGALETSIAFATFALLTEPASGGDLSQGLMAIACVLLSGLVGTLLILLVVSIYEDRPTFGTVGRLLVANGVVSAANATLAVVAVAVLWTSKPLVLLPGVLAGVLYLGYRSYARLQQKHDDLQLLYAFTGTAPRSADAAEAVQSILDQVRRVLRARVVELVLGNDAGGVVRLRSDRDGEVEERTHVREVLWSRVVEGGESLLLGPWTSDEDLRAVLVEHDLADALVAPLSRADGSAFGLLLAGDRIGDMRTFRDDDLQVFEALANHAGVALENHHLIDRLRTEVADKEHQSLHDSLTGLPNRLLFHERVARSLATAEADRNIAVMLLDLDRFKEVNDTLGHHNGDLLLQEIGLRLRRTLRGGDTVARLGGDEFAVLLPDLAGPDAAVAVANGIRHALARPFSIGDLTLDVGASLGIALWPDHGADPLALLQRADVAMYAAKERQTGVALYDPDLDEYSLDRLALVGELRQAIDHGELAVHYQPKAEVASGQVVGMEALVRWDHPRLGAVSPEEIIRIAEQTGLIRPLTLWVLGQALRECRRWRQDGYAFDVAVNLSFRNILDHGLLADVQAVLDEVGLPSSALTFEITESSMMVEPERTVAVLARLRAAGIGLAIDDFGTGYSSFSHLRHLPVDEIKIDRSFVTHLATDESDAMIVRTIVDLGRNLGLRVVAEGVEDEAAWERLAAAGCHIGQGYLLTPPLSGSDLVVWLEEAGHRAPSAVSADVVPMRRPTAGRGR